MNELLSANYICSYCGEENEISVDPTGGMAQTYTEDCTVCCRPNLLRIRILPDGNVEIQVEFEG